LWKVYYNYTGALPPTSYPTYEQVAYTYDGNSSLRTSVNEYNSGGTLLRTSSYTYDIMGRLDHYTPPVGLASGYYVDYDYNDLGQKTAVRITNGTTTPYNVGYDYFDNGWLKSVKNGANSVATYTYDEVGNREQINLGNGTNTTFAYDSHPRYRLNTITTRTRATRRWRR